MVQSTNAGMADLHFVYGMAMRIYQERYSHRHGPNRQTFVKIHKRLCKSGTFNRQASGSPATLRTMEVEEAVLCEFEHNPDTSIR